MPDIHSAITLLFSACAVLSRTGWKNTQVSSRWAKAGSLIMKWGSRCTPPEIRMLDFCAVTGPGRWMKYPPFWET
jgi:hypothetical protein